MQRVSTFLIGVALVASVVTVGPAAASTTLSERYIGAAIGPLGANTGCSLIDAAGPENVGGVCFEAIPEADTVELSIEDDVGQDVAAYVVFQDASGAILDNGVVCNEGTFELPPGTTQIEVWPESPPGGLQFCTFPSTSPTLSTPTTGTVTATLT